MYAGEALQPVSAGKARASRTQRHRQKGSANIGALCAGHAIERAEGIANAAPADTVLGMEIHPPQKLYTFIDESGQDTRGAFFVVATVLTAENHERVRQSLERLER